MSNTLKYSTLGFLFGSFLFLSASTFAEGSWSVGKDFMIFQQQGSTSDVYVGIGTENPQAKLEVNGKILAETPTEGDSANTVVTKGFLSGSIGNIIQGKWIEKDGNIYRNSGNVGIDTDTPTEKLDINGSILLRNTLFFGDGSNKKGSISNTNDGIKISPETNKQIFLHNNQDKGITIDSNGNTQVDNIFTSNGIFSFQQIDWKSGANITLKNQGEYSFDFEEGDGNSLLQVTAPGKGSLFNITSDGGIGVNTTPSGNLNDGNSIAIGDSDTGIKQQGDGEFSILTNNNERVRISSTGNVGIGTNFPSSKLEVNGDIKAYKEFSDPGDGFVSKGEISMGVSGADRIGGTSFFKFWDHKFITFSKGWADHKINLDGDVSMSGNVGIGTSSPSSKLDVQGDIKMNAQKVATEPWVSAQGFLTNYNETDPQVGLNTTNALSKWDGSALVSSGVFENSGNIGIGTNSPVAKLDVNGRIIARNRIRFASDASNNKRVWNIDNDSGKFRIFNEPNMNDDGAVRMTINGDTGNIGVGIDIATEKLEVSGRVKATAFVYPSDRRLKKNIVKIKNPLQKISVIKGVTFDWKSTGKGDVGLIAQDVEKIYPMAVATNDKGIKAVDYPRMVPLLVAAVQAQQEEISALKKEISALKK